MPSRGKSGRNPARIATEIDRFNAVNRQEAEKARARFVDITPLSRRAGEEPGLLAPDGLHYSGGDVWGVGGVARRFLHFY